MIELHLIHILLDDVQISVKQENETGKLFKSLIGSPHGDTASALFFIIILAVTLKNAKKKSNENNSLLPNHLSDHGYEPTENIVFKLDQQYADDISWASTSKTVLEKIETIIPEVLKDRNLFVKESKPKNTLSLETQQMNGKTAN